jgi:hypothetical protein
MSFVNMNAGAWGATFLGPPGVPDKRRWSTKSSIPVPPRGCGYHLAARADAAAKVPSNSLPPTRPHRASLNYERSPITKQTVNFRHTLFGKKISLLSLFGNRSLCMHNASSVQCLYIHARFLRMTDVIKKEKYLFQNTITFERCIFFEFRLHWCVLRDETNKTRSHLHMFQRFIFPATNLCILTYII